ncbi:MAG: ABC transporter six-transmembrane domain-containing protein [Pseudomonadota bacterium]
MTNKTQAATKKDAPLSDVELSIGALLRKFPGFVGVTWLLTICETTMTALAPLFIGFAIDGLLEDDPSELINLCTLLAALILVGVFRRLFDTRAYGTIRVELGREMAHRAANDSVSKTNARLGMGRELADFLEEQVPQLLSSFLQLGVAVVILWSFHPGLFYSALATGLCVLLIYSLVHRRFFRLNGSLNQQMEQQVGVLSDGSPNKLKRHLLRLRAAEVKISDTEAWVYGAMYTALLGFITFNLWYATGNLDITVGRIFSIVSYSWEFVEAVLVLPITLQSWSRLAEITSRINSAN